MTTYGYMNLFFPMIQLIIFATISGVFYWYFLIGMFLQLIALILACKYPKHLIPALTRYQVNAFQQQQFQQHLYQNQGVPAYQQAQPQQPYYPQQQYMPPPQHMMPPQQAYYPQSGQYIAGQMPPQYQPGPPQVIQGQPVEPMAYQSDAQPAQEPKETKDTKKCEVD